MEVTGNCPEPQGVLGQASRVAFLLLAACCLPLVLFTGCATLPFVRPSNENEKAGGLGILEDGYEDYVGVIHIHTNHSHDANGKFKDVVRVANAQRLDYVVVTEHNNLAPLREGLQGWHGASLVLVGTELSTKDGHLLVLNVPEEIKYQGVSSQEVIDEVSRRRGLSFIAHPYCKHARWRNWSVKGFTGLEVYNVAHDTLDENKLRLVIWTLGASPWSFYVSLLDRPYDPLDKWDQLLAQHGRVVGIGGPDAHEFHLLGLKFAPYEVMFQLARTHVLIPSKDLTKNAFYDALSLGHAYLSIDLMAEAKGFSFIADDTHSVIGIMGDEVLLSPRLRLSASLPVPAEVTLVRNGKPIAKTTGRIWHVPISLPGVYRLEATRHGKPWIFSNPIYVRDTEKNHK